MGRVRKETRIKVLERDKHRCRLCRGTERLTLHHVTPRRDGGRNEADNLATLCEVCHHRWNRCERNKLGLDFFDWLAGGTRRERAYRRCLLLKKMAVLRFSGASFNLISKTLNARDIPTLSGKLWTPGNARDWLVRNAPFHCSRREMRLIKWPYFAEPVYERIWRWHRLDTPVGICFQGRRRFFTMRYDFVHLVTRIKDPDLAVLRSPYQGVVIHRTSRNLQGSQLFPLQVPSEFGEPKTLLLKRGETARRVVRRGAGQYAYAGRRWLVPKAWGGRDEWNWQDWQSVDALFLQLCRSNPHWLHP